MKRIVISLLMLGMQANAMLRAPRVRVAASCCCPIVTGIIVSGVAAKAERYVNDKVNKAVNKALDKTFGKLKTD